MTERIVRGKEIKETKKTKKVKKNPPSKEISEKKAKRKIQFQIGVKVILIFILFFSIALKNSEKDQLFKDLKNLETEITALDKENDQLEVSIQNSLNLNQIEQAAKELLGMQKRTARQTKNINLPKKDYVEPRVEEIIIEDNRNIFSKIIDKILKK